MSKAEKTTVFLTSKSVEGASSSARSFVTGSKKKRRWTFGYTIHHAIVFWVTFVSYMFLHANRKSFSNLRSSMIVTWTPSDFVNVTPNLDNQTWNSRHLFSTRHDAEKFAGALDAIFMFTYAVGLYISGILGDRIDPRIVLSIGMISAAIINILFGTVTELCGFYSMPFYVVLWVLNGFSQSCGWPTVNAVMGNWFGRGNRGLVLGFWSSCASVGNIISGYICAAFLPYGYEYGFLVNASLLLASGIVVFFGLVRAPREIGLPEPTEDEPEIDSKDSQAIDPGQKPKPIGFFRAVLIPGVILYAFAYAGLKLVNYAIFFWLPYYLSVNFGWSDAAADEVSTYYDWGGIIGSVIGGYASDLMGKRSPVVVVQLVFSIIFLGVYTKSPNSQVINGVIMGIAGFFVNGAVNLISAAVTADLGRQEAVRKSADALSTVSGIVEGTGSVAAAIGQVLIPVLEDALGWNSTFYMFMILLALSTLILCKVAIIETLEAVYGLRSRVALLSSGGGIQINVINVRKEDSKGCATLQNSDLYDFEHL